MPVATQMTWPTDAGGRRHRHRTTTTKLRPRFDQVLWDLGVRGTPAPLRRAVPTCTLHMAFQTSSSFADLPPTFYPGQNIPTVLCLELDSHAFLPHHLHPQLTMSLVGTLHLPGMPKRTIICVSVSLEDGLALWARDAAAAHGERYGTQGLLGGKYTLPLSVQVPSTPRLPPTFTVNGAAFNVSYALTISLTCDAVEMAPLDLDQGQITQPRRRVLLAEAAKEFEMMPETMPTLPPRILPHCFWVPQTPVRLEDGEVQLCYEIEKNQTELDEIESDTEMECDDMSSVDYAESLDDPTDYLNYDRQTELAPPNTERWTLHPSLPTSTYSPTSSIPITLTITAPERNPELDVPRHVLVRLSLVRNETSNHAEAEWNIHERLVRTETVSTRYGLIAVPAGLEGSPRSSQRNSVTVTQSIPLMTAATWTHGFSTVLNVDAPSGLPEDALVVSSTFALEVDVVFLPPRGLGDVLGLGLMLGLDGDSVHNNVHQGTEAAEAAALDALLNILPPPGTFTPACSGDPPPALMKILSDAQTLGLRRTLSLPVVVGSVSEPRGAMHAHRWSDLEVDPEDGTARIVRGEAFSCEDGWLCAPPSYDEALGEAPYVY